MASCGLNCKATKAAIPSQRTLPAPRKHKTQKAHAKNETYPHAYIAKNSCMRCKLFIHAQMLRVIEVSERIHAHVNLCVYIYIYIYTHYVYADKIEMIVCLRVSRLDVRPDMVHVAT